MIRVILVEDHTLFREGIKRMLGRMPGISIVGEAQSAQEAIQVSATTDWDVIVADFRLQNSNAFDILQYWTVRRPGAAIVILSMYEESRYAPRLVQSGARGYLVKNASPEQLIEAITSVAAGGTYVSKNLAHILQHQDDEKNPLSRLTSREYEIYAMIVAGMKTSEIAAELGLRSNTVSTYKEHIRIKLGVASDGDIVRYAHDQGAN